MVERDVIIKAIIILVVLVLLIYIIGVQHYEKLVALVGEVFSRGYG